MYSEPIEKQAPLFFPLLPKEYQEKAQSSSKFKLQVKADSLYVSYQKVKDSTKTVTMRAGFKGKQKKNFWQRYNRSRIYPFIPIYLGVDIDRIRIAPNKDGNLKTDKVRLCLYSFSILTTILLYLNAKNIMNYLKKLQQSKLRFFGVTDKKEQSTLTRFALFVP